MTMFAILPSPICSAISTQGTSIVFRSFRLGRSRTRLELISIVAPSRAMASQRGRESGFMTTQESGAVTMGLAISSVDTTTEARAMPPRFSAP